MRTINVYRVSDSKNPDFYGIVSQLDDGWYIQTLFDQHMEIIMDDISENIPRWEKIEHIATDVFGFEEYSITKIR